MLAQSLGKGPGPVPRPRLSYLDSGSICKAALAVTSQFSYWEPRCNNSVVTPWLSYLYMCLVFVLACRAHSKGITIAGNHDQGGTANLDQ